ncbi:hypothetical protein HGRIS_001377 [Hohenbuehelia grisea]|uniref:Uncharacterized protein n=1 Tax=Hohenbuehelia grisea TaxID=104357 RepID=A0ABR3JQP0_9AGAR
MNAFPVGTSVFFWRSNSTVVYGTVTGTAMMTDGTQTLYIRDESGIAHQLPYLEKHPVWGTSLSHAEKLQVINTPRAAFVRELLTQFVNENNGLGGGALNWDRGRGADFRCVAQSVYCIARYPSGIRNVGTMPQLKKWLSASDALPGVTMDMIRETYRVFVQLVSDKMVNRVFHEPKKIAPLEFICIPILIAIKRSGMSPCAARGDDRDDARGGDPTAAVPDQDAAASTGEKRKRPK